MMLAFCFLTSHRTLGTVGSGGKAYSSLWGQSDVSGLLLQYGEKSGEKPCQLVALQRYKEVHYESAKAR